MHVLQAFFVLWILSGLSPGPQASAQPLTPSSMSALPEVQAWLVAQDRPPNLSVAASVLRLAVRIPSNHHAYIDAGDEGFFLPLAFTFPTLAERGIAVVLLSPPLGERDESAHATVLRGTGEFTFGLQALPTAVPALEALPLILRYQICNDVTKLCYPPQERLIALQASPVQGTAGAVAAPPAPTAFTLNERLVTLFGRHINNLFLTFALVFAAGLLALATPCVYPMLPITAAIFTARGEGSASGKRTHALVYFLGIICFYTLLGLMAALTGTALSAVMTNAWVHLGFAGLFTVLGFSMLGLYEFNLFSAFMTRLDLLASHVGGLAGTFVMGATTGLVVSPCVGPITGAILLDITGEVARAQALLESGGNGVLLRGTVLMTGFGMGLGVPFLLIGLLSSRLPSAGTWLTKTRYVLALPTLYFAYTYYMKGMEIATLPVQVAHMLLVSLVALAAACYLHVWRPLQHRFMHYASSVLLLTISGALVYGAFVPVESLRRLMLRNSAQQDATNTPLALEVYDNLQWWRDFALAQERARIERKALFIDFYAIWCANCKAFQRLTVSDTQLNAALQEAILVKIYDTDPVFRTLQQDTRYPELRGVGGQPLLPLFAVYSPQGLLMWKGQDYQAVHTMIAQLDQAKRVAIP